MITNKDQKALQNKIFLILVIFSGVMVLLAGRLFVRNAQCRCDNVFLGRI